MFNSSLTELISYSPYKTDAAGKVTETMPAVLVRLDPALITELRAKLTTAAQRTTFDSWTYPMTEVQCAEWHVPMWAGEASAVFLRVPAALWGTPNGPVPAKVKRFFAELFRDDEQ